MAPLRKQECAELHTAAAAVSRWAAGAPTCAGGGGKGRIDRGPMADARLDAPLPWDHIDTGISKFWLKTDLQRALEGATVPDCSHSGKCSECGVCGDDFGDNVVAEPPPIPEFEGHYVPDSRRVQRVRLIFEKTGDMVFVGHLDLLRMLERAVRRAHLPASADRSPYNPRTRMTYGAALPLGATSSAEVVELLLTEVCDAGDVRARLQAQVPSGIHFTAATAFPVFRLNGSLTEGLSALTRSLTYELTVRQVGPAGVDPADEGDVATRVHQPLKEAVSAVLSADEFIVEKLTKKKKATTAQDLRAAVLGMRALRSPLQSDSATHAAEVIGKVALAAPEPHGWGVVQVTVRVQADGGHVKPASLVSMLSQLSGRQFDLLHVHRCGPLACCPLASGFLASGPLARRCRPLACGPLA